MNNNNFSQENFYNSITLYQNTDSTPLCEEDYLIMKADKLRMSIINWKEKIVACPKEGINNLLIFTSNLNNCNLRLKEILRALDEIDTSLSMNFY
ncbi:hypothetical protein CMT41_11360 [Colwellia sp. MT41]|uniref:hypothetical protein n=1 Tax=Colwellia sp. MT41 TaxID=58049 RepID=UPI0007177046|nr:hypothetical protein [Colwellia sp. MT41]ALO35250.1 hypothetical protein CMT41_11360 [Colwellia sp. MT41]